MNSNRYCTAFMASALLATAASGDMVVLDFATDGGWANADDRYSVSTTNLHWWGGGYATDGILFAYDHDSETPGPGIGSLVVEAADGYLVQGLSFDLGGYGEVLASARYDILVDGELLASGDLDFEGASSLFTIDFGVDVEAGSAFEIVFDNYYRPAYVGLDNVAFNIVNVPAPGALALLGIAGVAGSRRRRG